MYVRACVSMRVNMYAYVCTCKCIQTYFCTCVACMQIHPVMCHYSVRYGVRLYGMVRKYGVQPYLYGFRPYIR